MSSTQKQYCSLLLDDLVFGIDVQDIQEVVRHKDMTPVPQAQDVVSGLINLRGQIVVALDLRKRFQLTSQSDNRELINVIVKGAEGPVSLLVDEIGDVVEPTNECREEPPGLLSESIRPFLTGVYKLERKLLLALDSKKVTDF